MDLRLPPTYFWVSQKEFQVRISSISLFNLQGTKNLCLQRFFVPRVNFIRKLTKVPTAKVFLSAHLSVKCLFILPDSLSFVKLFFNFFRSFSRSESLNLNFSKLFVRFRCPCGQLIYNTTARIPCQQLFSTFLTHYSKSFKSS